MLIPSPNIVNVNIVNTFMSQLENTSKQGDQGALGVVTVVSSADCPGRAGLGAGLLRVRRHQLRQALRHPRLQRLLGLLQEVGQAEAHLQASLNFLSYRQLKY